MKKSIYELTFIWMKGPGTTPTFFQKEEFTNIYSNYCNNWYYQYYNITINIRKSVLLKERRECGSIHVNISYRCKYKFFSLDLINTIYMYMFSLDFCEYYTYITRVIVKYTYVTEDSPVRSFANALWRQFEKKRKCTSFILYF